MTQIDSAALWGACLLALAIVARIIAWRDPASAPLPADVESRDRALRAAGASPRFSQVAGALAHDLRIQAINAHRAETGTGLTESKRAIDGYVALLRSSLT